LKQAAGAAFGVIAACALLSIGLLVLPFYGTLSSAAIVISVSAAVVAKKEKNQILSSIVWNIAAAILATGCSYFLGKSL
jgi:VIT1/CCC1 family predicted Fe2+/Mn2+ transporter